jgi:hypothetical protein
MSDGDAVDERVDHLSEEDEPCQRQGDPDRDVEQVLGLTKAFRERGPNPELEAPAGITHS